MVPCHVVAGVKTVEIALHALQLLFAVACQGLACLVLGTAPGLVLQAQRQIIRGGQGQRALARLLHKGMATNGKAGVEQAALHREWRHQWQALLHDGAAGGLADAPGQRISPVLAAVEVAHVLVVRVEHHALVRPDLVGRQRQKAAARARIALQRGDGDTVGEREDLQRHIVDGVDGAPRGIGRAVAVDALRRLDVVQVDAVGKELRPPGQHQHLRGARTHPAQRVAQALALALGHGAVVEVEVQPAHARTLGPELVVAQLVPFIGIPHQQHLPGGQRGGLRGKHARGGKLERAGPIGARSLAVVRPHMADPHRAIDRAAQQRRAAPRQQRTRRRRRAARHHGAAGGVGIEQAARLAPEGIEHARKAIGRRDLAQHRGSVVALPVDAALGLGHQRQPPPRPVRRYGALGRGLQAAGHEALQRPLHCHHGGLGGFAPVHAGLAGPGTHVEGLPGPDLARVVVVHGLQHGHAPVLFATHEHPVQRAGALVTRHAGVHHQAHGPRPDRCRYAPLEEGREHQVRPEQRHGLLGHRIGDVQLHRHLVPLRAQQAEEPLAQAVETVGEQQDAHGGFNRCAATARR